MIYFAVAQVMGLLLDLATAIWPSDHQKDLEILLLRQQLRILQRKHRHPPRISYTEKLALAVLTAKLRTAGSSAWNRLGEIVLIFKPATLLKWHRELARRK